MSKVTEFEEYLPHEVAELMCLKCFSRWIGVYPQQTLLKDIECKCGAVGYVIKTGQTLPEENLCDSCKFRCCGLNTINGSTSYCEYYVR